MIRQISPRRREVWLANDSRLLVIGFDDAIKIGGAFPDALRANVALQSGRLGK